MFIKSTETDILAISLLNHDKLKLDHRNLVINFSSSKTAPTHCCVNSLVRDMHSDPKYSLLQVGEIAISKIIGAFHFITGCDEYHFSVFHKKLLR